MLNLSLRWEHRGQILTPKTWHSCFHLPDQPLILQVPPTRPPHRGRGRTSPPPKRTRCRSPLRGAPRSPLSAALRCSRSPPARPDPPAGARRVLLGGAARGPQQRAAEEHSHRSPAAAPVPASARHTAVERPRGSAEPRRQPLGRLFERALR